MKNIFKLIGLVFFCLCGKIGYDINQDINPKKTKSNLKGERLIAYNPNSFGKNKEDSVIGGLSVSLGFKRYQAGYESLAVNSFKDAPDGYKVVEDRLYDLNFASEPPPQDAKPQIIPWGISRISAVKSHVITQAINIIVCVVDTGVDTDHPDLKEAIIGGSGHAGHTYYEDDNGHGTHVAGTISAIGNGIDVIGVTQSKLYIAKVLGADGSGFSSWIASGIVSCVHNGAHIINLSLGSPADKGPDELIKDAINYAIKKGLHVVAAAGNDGKSVGYPAALKGVIAVSASDKNDQIANFSSRGKDIDAIAPGVGIISTTLDGDIKSLSGTSMAAPHVSGVLALSKSVGKELKFKDIGLKNDEQGKGLVDALRSVR